MVKEIVKLSAVAWHSDDMQAETSTVTVWLSCSSPGILAQCRPYRSLNRKEPKTVHDIPIEWSLPLV